jgi:membrane protease YdiL (CAAX protease family)
MTADRDNNQDEHSVWGLAATLVWGSLIAIVFLLAQVFGLALFIGMQHPGIEAAEIEQILPTYHYNGVAVALATFMSLLFCLPLVIAAVKLKKGSSLVHYLGLRLVPAPVFVSCLLVVAGLIGAYDLLTWLLGREMVPDFSVAIYLSAEGSWFFLAAIVLAAPLLEEIFFRGFLFTGLAASFVGPAGAVLLTSFAWTAIHVQYEIYWLINIFVIGVALGVARYLTGSVLLTFVLHALINLAAMVVTALAVH